MTDVSYGDKVLAEWDLIDQENRVMFMEFLYDIYNRQDGLYTGLWEAYKDTAADLLFEQICFSLRENLEPTEE